MLKEIFFGLLIMCINRVSTSNVEKLIKEILRTEESVCKIVSHLPESIKHTLRSGFRPSPGDSIAYLPIVQYASSTQRTCTQVEAPLVESKLSTLQGPLPQIPSLDQFSRKQNSYLCAIRCKCKCHRRSSFSLPWLAKTIVGDLRLEYEHVRPACTSSTCRRARKDYLSLKLTYHFPAYLLHRYIAMSIAYSPGNGPKVSLRAPRIMDWTHPLWTYSKNGDLRAVQALFSRGLASPFDVDPEGCNALMNLAWRDDIAMAGLLIQEQAEISHPDQAGRTASQMLLISALTGRLGMEGLSRVKTLLKDEDLMDMLGLSPLHRMVLDSRHQCLLSQASYLVESVDVVDARKRTPLVWAVLLDDLVAVDILLSWGACVDTRDIRGKNALHYVRSSAVLSSLLQAGIDINVSSRFCRNTPLHEIAIRHDVDEVIEPLVQAGAQADARMRNGQSPLFCAVTYGHIRMTKKFIGLGADVNVMVGNTRCSPILEAVQMNHNIIVSLLLSHGANCTICDSYGRGILHYAAKYASSDTLAVLAKSRLRDLDLNLEDSQGETPDDYFTERLNLIGLSSDLQTEWTNLAASLTFEIADPSSD